MAARALCRSSGSGASAVRIFMLKAMGEYGLFAIVIGVWPQDHMLTYYNSDLEGRLSTFT
jgi:hypothetical protein